MMKNMPVQRKTMHPLINGIVTGLFLQLAIGPVFFLVAGITLTSTLQSGLAAVFAVTLADGIYIALSLLGVGGLTERTSWKRVLAAVSCTILIIFGVLMCYQAVGYTARPETDVTLLWTPLRSFSGAFVLTISSPLTAIFWTGIFTAKAIELQYEKRQLVWFGLGAGSATPIFLSAAMFTLSFGKLHIPAIAWQIANCSVGLALVYYGVSRAFLFSRLPKDTAENRAAPAGGDER